MILMKLVSVFVALIFSLGFVGYGLAGGNQGPGNRDDDKKLEEMLEELEDEKEEAMEELEDLEELEEIDVEMPEELLMKELKHGIELK